MHAPFSARDRVACVAALLALLLYGITGDYERPDPAHLVTLLVAAVCLPAALAGRRWAGYGAVACALMAGFYERLATSPWNGSDVMVAIDEALRVWQSGADPYAHVFTQTNPPGEPFPYPPGALVFYALGKLTTGTIFGIDRWMGMLELVLLGLLLPIVGVAFAALILTLAALAAPLITHPAGGSNDTALATLLILAIVLMAWSYALREGLAARVLWWCSAAFFGWAIAFKESGALVFLPILLYVARDDGAPWRAWKDYAVASLGPAAALTLGFALWDVPGFWRNAVLGLLTHSNIWGRNVWGLLTSIAPDARDAVAPFTPPVMIAGVVLVGVLCWRRPPRTFGGAVLQGCAMLGTLFILSRWTTAVYYEEVAPIVLAGVALALGGGDRGVVFRSSIESTS